jgi:hypothetical protein
MWWNTPELYKKCFYTHTCTGILEYNCNHHTQEAEAEGLFQKQTKQKAIYDINMEDIMLSEVSHIQN